jgi:hypothetical protein
MKRNSSLQHILEAKRDSTVLNRRDIANQDSVLLKLQKSVSQVDNSTDNEEFDKFSSPSILAK